MEESTMLFISTFAPLLCAISFSTFARNASLTGFAVVKATESIPLARR
jgi:hypothetical protein